MTTLYEKTQLEEVVKELQRGKVIAFPTDTVYGLGVVYDNIDALRRLKEAKGRPESKPIPMMISSLKQIEEVAYVSEQAKRLIQTFMPGAFTIVLKKKDVISDEVTNGFDTIAIRMPNDQDVLKMIEYLQKPLLVTSANLSDRPSATTTQEVRNQLDGRIDGILQGRSKGSVSSTIVDASTDKIKILRVGDISEEEIYINC